MKRTNPQPQTWGKNARNNRMNSPLPFRYAVKKTILLVDDDKSVRDSLSKALRSENYSVVVAANGQEAIEKFDDRIDLILLDLMMPVITGWNTYEQITALNPLVPVVVITAATNQYQQQQAAGMVALFQKPVEIPVLLQTMEQLLAENRETRSRRHRSYRSYFRFTHPFMSASKLKRLS